MEPVAHYGIRKGEKDIEIKVIWTDGTTQFLEDLELNQEIKLKQLL